MITEVSVIDKIEVLEDGQLQIRRSDKVLRDGVEIAKTYHRHVLAPGDDLNEQDARVVAVATALWTPDIIAAYKAKAAALALPAPPTV
jgi:urease accessory protein UreE